MGFNSGFKGLKIKYIALGTRKQGRLWKGIISLKMISDKKNCPHLMMTAKCS